MTTELAPTTAVEFATLQERTVGDVVVPGDERWDDARRAWNLAVDQRPAAVALPESAADVVEIVRFAARHGLRVAPQGTGHNAAALGGELADTMLVKTERMRGVAVDPVARTARVEAGVLWIEVVRAAAKHGLAALAGSSPDVGVVGYTLGGGLSWLARKHGIGANQVTAVEIVTADGRLVRADADTEAELFWAVRGGGGAFGVVTAMEFRLIPLTEVYAGILWFPVERAAEILKAWRAWTDALPDEMTSVGRILQFPPIPQIPEPVRGRSFVVVQAIYAGDPADGAALLEPLRALGPVMDTVAPTPVTELSKLHMDPDEPAPAVGDGGTLHDVDDELIDALVESTVGSPILSVEVRHLGGAVARRHPDHGAADAFHAPFIAYAVGLAPGPEAAQAVERAVAALWTALAPWEAEHTYMNFADTRRRPSALFTGSALARLRDVKAAYDPDDIIRSNHPVA